jgi:phytol kinase
VIELAPTALLMAAILLVQATLLAAAGWLRSRGQLSPEASRKFAHIGSGLIALPLPWLFDRVWPVLLLCGLGLLALISLRVLPALGLLRSLRSTARGLHDVERLSLGDLLFPIAVAALFALAHETPVLYALPLLALTLADAAAALVGRRHPIGRFATAESHKSLAGTLAFAATTFLLIIIPLLAIAPIDAPRAILIALGAAVLLAMVEAISFRGLDNLFVPLLGYAILAVQLTLSLPELFLRSLVALGLLVLLLRLRPAGAMLPDAIGALALFLYATWAIAGPRWLIPAAASTALILFAFRRAALCGADDHIAPRGAPVVVAMSMGSLVWVVLAAQVDHPHPPREALAFATGLAMATAMLVSTALASRVTAGLSALAPLTIAWFTMPMRDATPHALGVASAISIAAGVWPIGFADERLRWAVRSLLILAASTMMAWFPFLERA